MAKMIQAKCNTMSWAEEAEMNEAADEADITAAEEAEAKLSQADKKRIDEVVHAVVVQYGPVLERLACE